MTYNYIELAEKLSKIVEIQDDFHVKIKDVNHGYANFHKKLICLPKWLDQKDFYFIEYYILHELLHLHPLMINQYHSYVFKEKEINNLKQIGISIVYRRAYPAYLWKGKELVYSNPRKKKI